VILHRRTFSFNGPVLDPDSKGLFPRFVRKGSCLPQTSTANLFKIFKLLFRFIGDGKVSKIEVLNRPFRFLIFCLPVEACSEKGELIAKGFSLLAKELEMTGIIPPFGFKFRMRKMVLRKGEDFPRQSTLEVLCIYS
jgi:hypothetical protein